jgi:hypothetical protein
MSSAYYFVCLFACFQSRYFDFDDDDRRTDTGLAAGTPALLDHVLTHPMTCSLQ